jgi:Na+-driven multidrug efflux pump
VFVVPLAMGVAGAAWATVIAQGVSAVGCILYAMRKIPILRLNRADFVYDGEILGQTIKLGVPGALQNSVIAIGSMLVQSVVNGFGAVVVAAYTTAGKLDQLAVQPILSLSMGAATFTAQNIGAGKIERVKQGFWAGVLSICVFSAFATVVLFVFGKDLMALFIDTTDASAAAVLEAGEYCLRVTAAFYAILGIIILLENVLRGAGDVVVPVISNMAELTVRVIIAYAFASLFGYAGIWWNAPLGWIMGTLICGARYLSGRWKDKGLIQRTDET